jgi:hypothetical protein
MKLEELRNGPRAILEKEDLYANYDNIPGPLGGNVSISASVIKTVNMLKISPGGADYYYPYIFLGAGVVNVQMPVTNGTIALTGGMNGCALDVRLKDGYYSFYHDNNGNYMTAVKDPGIQVCRIEVDAYWGGYEIKTYNGAPTTPIVQFVCVYSKNYWHVGASGILLGMNTKTQKCTEVVDTFIPTRGKYRGYFNDTIHLIQR